MKKREKIAAWLILLSLIFTGFTLGGQTAYAAPTATFSVSGGSATLGGNVSVTVSVSGSENIAFAQVSLNYSANILEYQSGADSGGSGRVNILFDCGSGKKSASRTITFKAVGTGNASLSLDNAQATPMDANSGDWMSASVSGGGSVTVSESKALSKDAHIASIEVSPGTLKPAFNPDVFKYTMEVENSVTSIAVSAKASHAAASITSVKGATDLKVGTNKVTVVCTAESGGTASYVITVTRKKAGAQTPEPTTKPASEEVKPEETDITCELNGNTYFVGQTFKDKDIPAGFEAAEVQYQEKTIKGAQFKNNNKVQLLYLLDAEKKNGQFFVYYPESGIIGELVQVSFSEGNTIYLLDPTSYGVEIPSDVEERLFNVDDRELKGYYLSKPKDGVGDPAFAADDGYVLDRASAKPDDFVFIYGINSEGVAQWYSYDLQEKTLQRLVVFASEIEEVEEVVEQPVVSDGTDASVKKMLEKLKVYRIILLGGGTIVLLLIVLCVLLAINSKKGKEDSDATSPDEKEEPIKAEKAKKKELSETKKDGPVEKIEKSQKSDNSENSAQAVTKKIERPAEKTAGKTEEKPEGRMSAKPVEKAAAPVEEQADSKTPSKPAEEKKPEPKTVTEEDDFGLEFFDLDEL